MSERTRDILVVVSLVALLLAAFAGLLALRRGRGDGGAEPGGSQVQVTPTPAGRPDGAPAAAGAGPAAALPSGAGASGVGHVPAASPAVEATAGSTGGGGLSAAPWQKRAPVEFTPTDLAQCGQGVRLDLGQYEVTAGQEFEVQLGLSAPALESLTVNLKFDSEALALVPGSAAPVGTAFRSGIECYAGRSGGTMVLIHAGTPGQKNLDGAKGTPVVAWRMRALRAGATRLEVLPQSSFTNGRGEDETYRVSGGDIAVR